MLYVNGHIHSYVLLKCAFTKQVHKIAFSLCNFFNMALYCILYYLAIFTFKCLYMCTNSKYIGSLYYALVKPCMGNFLLLP
jgi:hypothetical protein